MPTDLPPLPTPSSEGAKMGENPSFDYIAITAGIPSLGLHPAIGKSSEEDSG